MKLNLNLSGPQLKKADKKLQNALSTSDAEAVLRVVVTLACDVDRRSGSATPRSQPVAAPMHDRRALIEHRKAVARKLYGPVIESLKGLDLTVCGGEITRAVVVEGTVAQIAEGIKLDGVDHVILDQPLKFKRPGQRRVKTGKRSKKKRR